jgi:hypothetical protein
MEEKAPKYRSGRVVLCTNEAKTKGQESAPKTTRGRRDASRQEADGAETGSEEGV